MCDSNFFDSSVILLQMWLCSLFSDLPSLRLTLFNKSGRHFLGFVIFLSSFRQVLQLSVK